MMQVVSARHDQIVGEVVGEHGGEAVRARAEGDSAFAVFDDPAAAARAAIALQRRIVGERWPAGIPVSVRMALHSGPLPRRPGEHYGPVVNRCVRLRGVAHGGQIVVSGVTAGLIEDRLGDDADLVDLGTHRLKDLTEPEHVWQLAASGLEHDFPPVRSIDVARHNVPSANDPFVGRADDVRQVRRLLDTTALVTVTGTGGVGKTRLAREVAERRLDVHADGVWWVELADMHDGDGVVAAVAGAVGVRRQPGRPLADTLAEHLQGRSTLLVLDNAEHLVEPVGDLAEALLRAGPGVRMLVTSRRALGLPGESVWPLQPLAVPSRHDAAGPDALLQLDGVRLFVTRAAGARPGFELHDANAGLVAAICERVEGIPLAIEMAAAQVADHQLDAILSGLEHRLAMAGGDPSGDDRHRTLRATIDWSHSLLAPAEQVLYRRLAVFAGFGLEAAEAVCTAEPIEEREVLDLLARLVDASLVVADDRPGDLRYRLLETVRDHATEQLADSGEGEAVRERHLRWCVDVAGDEHQHRFAPAPELAATFDRLDIEHDNIRAALRWALQRERPDAPDLARRLVVYWEVRGLLAEARRWLERAAGVPTDDVVARLRVLMAGGTFAGRTGDHAGALRAHQEVLALAEEAAASAPDDGIRREALAARGHALTWLGEQARLNGDLVQARQRLEEAYDVRLALDRNAGAAQAMATLGAVEWQAGDLGAAARCFERSVELYRVDGHVLGQAAVLHTLAGLSLLNGDLSRARELADEAMEIFRDIGDRPGMAEARVIAVAITQAEGRHDRALQMALEALHEVREHGREHTLKELLGRLVGLYVQRGDGASAAAHASEVLARATPSETGELVREWLLMAVDGERSDLASVLAGALERIGAAVPATWGAPSDDHWRQAARNADPMEWPALLARCP